MKAATSTSLLKKTPLLILVILFSLIIFVFSGCSPKPSGSERKRFNVVWEVISGKSDDVYVVDDVAPRIDESGQPTNENSGQEVLQLSSKGELRSRMGSAAIEGPAAVDSGGNIIFSDRDSIKRLRKTGKTDVIYKRSGSLKPLRPISIATFHDLIYVVYSSDLKNDIVVLLDISGRKIGSWGVKQFPGSANTHIAAITTDKKGSVYLLASAEKQESPTRVEKLTPDGKLVKSFETPYGRSKGDLRLALDITIDDGGDIFIADAGNNRIQKFSGAGLYLTLWGDDFLFGNSDQAGPTSITAAGGYLYAGDPTRRVVYKFSLDGRRLGMWRGIR